MVRVRPKKARVRSTGVAGTRRKMMNEVMRRRLEKTWWVSACAGMTLFLEVE